MVGFCGVLELAMKPFQPWSCNAFVPLLVIPIKTWDDICSSEELLATQFVLKSGYSINL